MERCNWPVIKGDDIHVCNRRVVEVYVKGGIRYPRCRLHATERARAVAREGGFEVVAAL